MNYCEKCKSICPEETCSECGNTVLREARNDDYCLLLECDTTLAKMLEDSLKNEYVPCALVPNGNGARSALGLNLENFLVYVPYEFYNRAYRIYESFTSDSTEDLKKNLLENREKWHIVGMFTEKKFKKKLKIAKDSDLFLCCEGIVANATKITDEGVISSCVEGGHYLVVRSDTAVLMFNSITYELIHAKWHK